MDKIELDLYLKDYLINEEKKLLLDNNKVPKILENLLFKLLNVLKKKKIVKK